MDKAFPPVTLEYKGTEYTVEPDRVWGLLQTIEDVISRGKLGLRLANQDPPETKIAEAYAKALRYAGCKDVKPEPVLRGASLEQMIKHGMALFEILGIASQPEDVEANASEGSGEDSGKGQAGE